MPAITGINSNGWDFTKFPEDRHEEAAEALASYDFEKLRSLHNEYELSDFDYNYCCFGTAMQTWWNHWRENFYHERETKEGNQPVG